MKKILLVLGFIGVFSSVATFAQTQTFSVASDTVYATIASGGTVNDNITDISTHDITLKWRVVDCDFPGDWLATAAFGICDNHLCYNNNNDSELWNPTSRMGTTFTSYAYHAGVAGLFDLTLDLSNTTSIGVHYVTVNIQDPSAFYSKAITFVINKTTTAIQPVTKSSDDILLYPNPTVNELNVVYDPAADIKNISVYNIIGKVMSVYKVNGSSANLNLENIPSGIYFVRLVNGRGEAVITRKFTKQ